MSSNSWHFSMFHATLKKGILNFLLRRNVRFGKTRESFRAYEEEDGMVSGDGKEDMQEIRLEFSLIETEQRIQGEAMSSVSGPYTLGSFHRSP